MFYAEMRNIMATKTAWVLLIASALMAIASTLGNLAAVADSDLSDTARIELAMHSSTVATLVFALVAGIVSMTSEFRHGRIDQLLLSQPRRSHVFATKAAAGAVLGITYGVVGSFTALGGAVGYLGSTGVSVELLSAPVLRPLIGVLIGAPLFAIFGVAIGNAVRSQAGALAGALAMVLLVEPTAILGIPSIGRWLPAAASLGLTLAPDENLLGQAGGAAVLAGWTGLACVVGNYRLNNVDL